MAAKVRIKNDIILFFDLYTGDDQQPEDLSDIVNLSVQLKADVFGHVIIPIFSVTGNRIRIDVPAELQSVRGMYTLIVSYNRPNPEGTPPLNTFTIDQPAFELVARSIEAEPGAEGEPTVQTIQLNGVIGVAGPVGPIGPKGETGDDAYEVWAMQPGNEGKTIEDYFIFLQNPAYEAGLTAVGAAQIALGAQQASEGAQAGSVAAMEKSDDFSNEAEDVEVEEGKFSSKHFSIKSSKSAEKSQKWASEAEDVVVEGGEYSAKHYSLKAAAEKEEAVSAKEAAELAKTGAESARDTALSTVSDVRETGEKNSVAISTLENTINSANINQETTATVTGVDTVLVPKTAANTGMSVQLFGQSAENLVVNGDFRNGVTGWSVNSNAVISHDNINKYMLVTAGSSSNSSSALRAIPELNGVKSYYKVRFRVTNSSCAQIRLTQGVNAVNISSPVMNTWYESSNLITPNATYLTITHQYADSATANGKVMAVDYVMAINLTATFGAGNEPTKEQCDLLFANYFEGSDNVLGTGRVRSVGKNLFNRRKIEFGVNGRFVDYNIIEASGQTLGNTKLLTTGFKSNTQYSLRIKGKQLSVIARCYAFYTDGTFDRATASSTSFITQTLTSDIGKTVAYFGVGTSSSAVAQFDISECMIVEGSVLPTTYEPYRQSILQLTTPPLRSNGLIKDEIRKGTNGYELVKKVGVGTLTEKITQPLNFLTGYQVRENTAVDDSDTFTTTGNGGLQFNGVIAGKWYKLSISGTSTAATFGVYSTGGVLQTLLVGFNGTLYVKPDYSNIYISNRGAGVADITSLSLKEVTTVEAIAATSTFTELGSNVHYTLATPIITTIAHAGLLNSNSNGTAYFEPIIADAGVYSTNLTVQLTDYQIASFESIRKYANGTYTELSTATAVIAGDGLSFTHPDLVSGDLVMFTYAYANESIGHSMTLTHYDSRFVEADTSNGKVYRWGVTITNGVPTLTVQEV